MRTAAATQLSIEQRLGGAQMMRASLPVLPLFSYTGKGVLPDRVAVEVGQGYMPQPGSMVHDANARTVVSAEPPSIPKERHAGGPAGSAFW
jgi:hypothetical protein